jgi:hypothetical protein
MEVITYFNTIDNLGTSGILTQYYSYIYIYIYIGGVVRGALCVERGAWRDG